MRAFMLLALVTLPSVAWAQQRPENQPSRRGFRVEAGLSDNHTGHDRYPGGAFRAFGVVDHQDRVSIEGGVLAGMPFLGGDGGV